MKYFDEAKALWRAHVPPSGQAKTVHGELIRAVKKLRDEACRNGNVNWDEGHETLAKFLRDTLIGSGVFDRRAQKQISSDVDRLLDFEHPETDDDPYDRLTDYVVEWSRAHPEPIAHVHNPKLRR